MEIITKYMVIAHDKENPHLTLSYPEYDSIETPSTIYEELKNSYDCQITKKTTVVYESCVKPVARKRKQDEIIKSI
jgi:hypothetical protein